MSTDLPEGRRAGARPPFRILIGDDHAILLDMLRNLLQGEFAVVGTARDGLQLVDLAVALRPEMVLADIRMPGCSGIEAGRRILRLDPTIRLIFLTMEQDAGLAAEAFGMGAAAFLLKAAPASEFLDAIRSVAAGGRYLARSIAEGDIDRLLAMRRNEPLAQISAREREVVALLVSGLPMKTVARRLGITARTVAFHKYKAMETLGLKDNAQLMEFALRRGLLAQNEPVQPHPSQPHPSQPHPSQPHPSQPHPSQPHPSAPDRSRH